MAITINDSFLNNSPKALDSRSLKNGLQPYTSLQDVYDNYPSAYRAPGATVIIREDGYNITYWFRNGSNNSDLVRKTDEAPARIVTTGTTQLSINDQHIIVNAVGDVILNLPSASNQYGKKYRFTRTDSGSHNVSIVGNIQEKINSKGTLNLVAQFETYEIEANNLGTTSTPNPGWLIIANPNLQMEEEPFSPVVKFNKDKVRYHTLTQNITYSISPTNKKYGVVVTDIIAPSNDFVVIVPESFIRSGSYKKGVENIISMTLLPATQADNVSITIRQDDIFDVPEASEVHLMGDTVQGDMVDVMYTFSPGGSEGNSTITWYKADNASGLNATIIAGQNNMGLQLTQDLCAKYVRAGVIPVNTDGYVGLEAFSPWEGPVTGCTTSNTTTLPGTFSPLSIANLSIWLGDTKTLNGSQVLQWTDKSGQGNHFLPALSTTRPTIQNGLNGIQGIQFSGAQNLRGPALSDTDSYTIFTVGSIGLNRGLDGNGDGWSIASMSPTTAIVMDGSGADDYENTYAFNTSTGRLATTVIVNSGTNASSLTIYDAGVNRGTLNINNRTLRSSSIGFQIGQAGVAANFEVGNIQEVVVYNRALNSTEITNLNNYFKTKYNIA